MNAPEPLGQIIHAILKGNPDGFHVILREYGPPLRGFLASQIFQQSDVDDLAQDVFVAAYRNLHTYDHGQDFGAWLRGIARNKLRHYFDRVSRRSSALATFQEKVLPLMWDEFEDLAGETRARDLQRMLGCVEQLPQRMRQTVRSWLHEGKATALAKEMECSVHAIYQLQHRAVNLLRLCMKKNTLHER
jgi:RNA polymerase sigma-70 factor (ECF subfamily)